MKTYNVHEVNAGPQPGRVQFDPTTRVGHGPTHFRSMKRANGRHSMGMVQVATVDKSHNLAKMKLSELNKRERLLKITLQVSNILKFVVVTLNLHI